MSEKISIESRIEQLGYTLPTTPQPVAAYVPAVMSGNYVYTSGQLPFVNGELLHRGKLSSHSTGEGHLTLEQAQECARIAALNALSAVHSVLGDLNRIKRIVKVVGFVASAPEFTQQPQVINGASELLHDILGEQGVHARSAVGVAVLPLDAPVEVELIVEYV
ncbi:RidA family protein [Rothia sp. P13129]|uniref:RidA family protein n=1 Tax=Rothia sp. P13129 TaxID=3402664 RepID=UPI003AC523F0